MPARLRKAGACTVLNRAWSLYTRALNATRGVFITQRECFQPAWTTQKALKKRILGTTVPNQEFRFLMIHLLHSTLNAVSLHRSVPGMHVVTPSFTDHATSTACPFLDGERTTSLPQGYLLTNLSRHSCTTGSSQSTLRC